MARNLEESLRRLKERIAKEEEFLTPIDKIRPNAWNFNTQDQKTFNSLKAALGRFGWVYPIIVREVEGGYEIIDGEHRWRALKELGVKQVPVKNLGHMDDLLAKELMLILNKTRGEANPEKLGLSLARIVKHMKEEGEDPLEFLPYDERQLERFLSFSEDFREDESAKVCDTHQWVPKKLRRCKKCGMFEP